MLQAIKVKGHVDNDGILKLEVPVEYPNQDVEVVVVRAYADSTIN